MKRCKNLLGMKFGRLTAIQKMYHMNKSWWWEAKCDCGNNVIVRSGALISGNTKSCGCLSAENRKVACRTHGMCYSKEFRTYNGIKNRCYDENSNSYKNYGGRGIKVCDRWVNSFENFLEDVGLAPSPKHTIDRIDNNRNYEPGNVRWATKKEQQNNKRNNIVIEFDNQRLNLSQWAEKLGVNQGSLRSRFYRGWSASKAFTTPYKQPMTK